MKFQAVNSVCLLRACTINPCNWFLYLSNNIIPMRALKVFFIIIPALADTFAGKSLLRMIVLMCQFWYFALTRKTFLRGVPMQFQLWFNGKQFEIAIESIVDIAVLQEVFVMEEYRWDLPVDPKTIFDLGAHFGDTTLYYHLKYPHAKIYAVEPAPDTFARLCLNTKNIPNIIPIQAGVANTDGTLDLYLGHSSFGYSFTSRADTKHSVTVPTYTLTTLMKMHSLARVDLIKFDIEGAEDMLFGGGKPGDFACAYIGEVHGDLMTQSSEDFIKQFDDFVVEKEVLRNTKRCIIKCIEK